MLQGWLIIGAALAYLGVLFAIAYHADRRADAGKSVIARPVVYALSMAVYATAWTFYGSVGRAASGGVGFLPIYIGPTLVCTLWWVLLRKIIRISRVYRITSLADFVASRYGKSAAIAGLVTLIAVVGNLPYISLQLKAISSTFELLSSRDPALVTLETAGEVSFLSDSALYIAIILAAFTIIFGTRHLDASERHEGMVAAIAFESLVKLAAFLAVGLYVTYGIFDGFGDVFERARRLPELASLLVIGEEGGPTWASLISASFLAMLAIMLLPRQFQVSVVENVDENHVRTAIWLFPLYLLVINLFVPTIAFGGLVYFGGRAIDPDTFVLTLPLAEGQRALALLVFVGGLSAATGMVIVETIALSTMVCNDLVMPLLLRWRALRLAERSDLSGLLLGIRRGAILVIVLLGYLYFRLAGEAYALVSIGLISFAAVAQVAPALLGGLFWKGGTRAGALAGLGAGFLVWLYTLLLPAFARSGWLLPLGFLEEGPFGIALLRPLELFGVGGLDPITHAMLWSMLFNCGAYIGVSLSTSQSVVEHSQATLFVDVFKHSEAGPGILFWRGGASVQELRALLSRFLGQEKADDVLHSYARQRHLRSAWEVEADANLVQFAETQLAGAIGGASAHAMVASVVKEEPLTMDEVLGILDEASQLMKYSRQLEQKSGELQAASADLRRANERLKELDRMKDEFVSHVSHELRTPLTSIRAFSEILRDHPNLDAQKRSRYLSVIITESERLTRLINQILDVAKMEAGALEWNLVPLDPREVLEHAAAATRQLFDEKRVTLEVDLPAEASRVVADRDRLIQVVINLLSNAVKFCEEGVGRVRVSLGAQPEAIRVDVRDNGPGIDPKDHERIFERFRQAGDTVTEKARGTGLGLSISREIVQRFGGRLWVESELGQGATFSFTLPAAPAGSLQPDGSPAPAGRESPPVGQQALPEPSRERSP